MKSKKDFKTPSLTDDQALDLEATGEIVHLACPNGDFAIYVHRDHKNRAHHCARCGSDLVFRPRVVKQ